MPLQPLERGPLLADLAARHGAPHELAALIAAPVASGPVQYLIDVSEYQGHVDMGAVRDSGVDGVIIKVAEGTSYIDPSGQANLKNANTAGEMVLGGYTYMTASSSPATQAQTFLRLTPHNAIHALDVEAPGPLDPRYWVDEYRRHEPDHPLWLYSGKWMWSQRSLVHYDGVGLGALWNAGAVPGGYVPGVGLTLAQAWARVGAQNGGLPWGGWDTWTALQMTESASVPGVQGYVDGSVFRGTRQQLLAWTGDEMTSDDWAKLQTMLNAIPAATGRAVHSQQLFAEDRPDGKPLTIGDAILATYKRPDGPAAVDIADALLPALTAAIKALPAGTATVDDATIAKVVAAVLDGFATRLVR